MSSSTQPTRSLPQSAWVLGWAFFVGQVFLLAKGGVRDDNGTSIVLSVVLSVLVVWWFSVGVLRAAPVRSLLVLIVLALSGLLQALGALVDPGGMSGGDWIELVATLAQLGALVAFRRTAYYAQQRADPEGAPRADVTALLTLALVVGFIGGIAESEATQARVQISF